MRKLKLQVQISADGFVAGPNGEMDWMLREMDGDLMDFVNDLTDSSDCIVMGRKLAEGFIPYWENVIANPQDPQYAFGQKMVHTPKVVFSRTLTKSFWDNTTLAKGELASAINKLKNGDGKDIIVYGGAGFVSNLIAENLIDELNLFINPAALGQGMQIFHGSIPLQLIRSRVFGCGIVVNTYQAKKA
jgi:dihydrofolate reductase